MKFINLIGVIVIGMSLACSQGLQSNKKPLKESEFTGFYVKTSTTTYVMDLNQNPVEVDLIPNLNSEKPFQSEVGLLAIDENGVIEVSEFSELNENFYAEDLQFSLPTFAETAHLSTLHLGSLDQNIRKFSKVNISQGFVNKEVKKTLKDFFAIELEEKPTSQETPKSQKNNNSEAAVNQEQEALKDKQIMEVKNGGLSEKSIGQLWEELDAIYSAKLSSMDISVDEDSLRVTIRSTKRKAGPKIDEALSDTDVTSENFPIESREGFSVVKYEKISAEDYLKLLSNLKRRFNESKIRSKVAQKIVGEWVDKDTLSKGIKIHHDGLVLYGDLAADGSGQFLKSESIVGYARLSVSGNDHTLVIKPDEGRQAKYEVKVAGDGEITILPDDKLKVDFSVQLNESTNESFKGKLFVKTNSETNKN